MMLVHEVCETHLKDDDISAEKDKEGKIVKSFCNVFVWRVCKDLGNSHFVGRLANEIFSICEKDTDEWQPVGMDFANDLSRDDCLVLAAARGKQHGHIAIVYPGMTLFSGKWDCYVPRVAHTYLKPEIVGVNYAFKEIPTFFRFLARPGISERLAADRPENWP